MTTFLKGDSSAEITLVLAEGCDYSGKTVHLEYQGARRSFSGVAAGGSLTFSFTAAETASMSLGAYPVRVWIEDENGGTVTIHNGAVKLRVTDCVADMRSDEAMYLDVRGGLHGLEGLPDRWNENDLKAKIDEIIRRLGGTVALLLVCALPAFCAGPLTVQTAPKGEVYNDAQIVTNVDFDVSALEAKADASNTYTRAETDAAIVRLAPAPDFTTNNTALVETIEATAPAPGNYAAVSNAAMNVTNIICGVVTNTVGRNIEYDGLPEGASIPYFDVSDGIAYIEFTLDGERFMGMADNNGFPYRIGCANEADDKFMWVTVNKVPIRNALGLARYEDVPSITSNTVTKAYVENLGIEAGVDAQTVTNIVADATNGIPTRAEIDRGWWSDWSCNPATLNGAPITIGPGVGDNEYAPMVGDTIIGNPMLTIGPDGSLRWPDNEWIGEGELVANRHRVAAPVPTKPEDIGAASTYALAAVRALADAATETNAEQNAAIESQASQLSQQSQAIAAIGPAATNYTESAIADADTAYRRVVGITNLNQSVQYVAVSNTAPTTLSIELPDASTADWMLYIISITNVSLSLPPATWWMADAAYTNDIAPATPTALYFSQITDGVFLLGRQELTPITIVR